MYFMDCHCHIGVDGHLEDPKTLMDKLDSEPRAASKGFFNIMSTNHIDLEFLAALVDLDKNGILVPHFGIHPWYSHLFSTDRNLGKSEHYNSVISNLNEDLLETLPDPIYLEDHIERIIQLIYKCQDLQHDYAIGEIGLDKLFRIPTNGFYGNQDHKSGVTLTTARVSMDHQKAIFLRQLQLANDLVKPVSIHCVKAQGPFFDILHSSFLEIPVVTLHSYTGSPDQAKRWIKEFSKQKRKLCFSFSNCINGDGDKRISLMELLKILSDEQILLESDMPIDHFFLHDREDEYFKQLYSIQKHISEVKGITEAECNIITRRNSLGLHLH